MFVFFAYPVYLYMVSFYRWDIIAERLGFMLVFGDLVWIPFTFSIQACNTGLEHLTGFVCSHTFLSQLRLTIARELLQ